MKEKLMAVVEIVKANPGKVAIGVGVLAATVVVVVAAVRYQSAFPGLDEMATGAEEIASTVSQVV